MIKFRSGVFRRHLAYFSCLVVFGLLAGPAQASGKLTPHIAEYNIKISVLSGRLRTQLKETETGYSAEHVVSPTGITRLVTRGEIAEISEFGEGSEGLYPIAYRSNDTISREKPSADIRFDWDAEQARGTVDGEDVVMDLQGLSHDRVSIQYELMYDLLNEGPSPKYRLFEVDDLRILNIRRIGTKQVKVPAGSFDAIGIQHQAENSSRVTTLWCVEELGYLPVIIEQHRDGKRRVRATLRDYTPIN